MNFLRNGMRSTLLLNLIATSSLILSSISEIAVYAAGIPEGFTLQGRLLATDGITPISDTVAIKVTVLNPAANCILYEESQTGIDLTQTAGVFATTIGTPSPDPKRTVNDPGKTMVKVFANAGSQIVAPGPNCLGGYTPAAGDGRILRVTVTPNSTNTPVVLSPDMSLGMVPQAKVAETLQGLTPADFIQATGNISQVTIGTLVGGSVDASALHHHNSLYLPIGQSASSASTGALTSGDWTLFNSKVSSVTAGGTPNGITIGGTATAPTVSMSLASGSATGALSSGDWTTFNNKQPAGNYMTALTGDVSASGAGSASATVNSVGGSTAANVSSATVLANAATAANTNNAIVRRDGSGNFSAGTITANLTGTASGNVASVTATAGTPVTIGGTATAPTVGMSLANTTTNGYLSSTDWNTFNTAASTTASATSANTANTVVKRDANGSFSAGTITANTSPLRVIVPANSGTTAWAELDLQSGRNQTTSPNESYWNIANDASSGNFLIRALGDNRGGGTVPFVINRSGSTATNIQMWANVGVGVASPAGPLHIVSGTDGTTGQGNCGTESASCPASAASGYGLVMDSAYTNGAYRWRLSPIDRGSNISLYVQSANGTANAFSNVARFGTNQYDSNVFATFGQTYLGGNVGIGNTTPNSLLTLGNVLLNGANNYEIKLGRNDASTTFRVGQAASNNMFLGWNYNATASSAYGTIGTYGGSNPIVLQESGGNVGIGTAVTNYKLDVAGTIGAAGNISAIGGVLKSSFSSDTGGAVYITNPSKTTNGTAKDWVLYNMTNGYGNSLQFWTYDGIGCSPGGLCHGRVTFMDNGKVGIGMTPSYMLDVAGDINSSGSVRASGVALTSDRRFKKNIHTLENSLDSILEIRGVSYQWRKEEFPDKQFNDRSQIGVIAQEVEKVFPEVVDTDQTGYKAVNYPALVAPLIEAVKELYQKFKSHSDQTDRRISSLEAELASKDKELLILRTQLCKHFPDDSECKK